MEAPADSDLEVEVKLRSTSRLLPATLRLDGRGATVMLREAEYGVAPGQACVFYRGDRVLGGGWIAAEARREAA
jgi:tRNA-uridine 2-sulfurtransferase